MAHQQDSNSTQALIRTPIGILAGASYPFRALGFLLQTPKLWGYVLIPVLVNLIIGTALYLGLLFPSLQGIDALVAELSVKFNAMIAGLPAWLSYLSVFDFYIRLAITSPSRGWIIASNWLFIGAIWGNLRCALVRSIVGAVRTFENW